MSVENGSTDRLSELPDGWRWAPLGELAKYINGRAFKPSDWGTVGLPIIRIQNLNNSNARFNYFSKPVEDKYVVRDGDLLISWSASLDAFVWNGGTAVLNQHIFRVEPNQEIISKLYLYYVVRAYLQTLKDQTHGTGMQHITRGPFEATKIPLAPLSEQQRIVNRIESLFAEVRTARAALERTEPLLKKFRQSVLSAAFRGELTERDPKDESASALLERIQAERRKKWQENSSVKGKSPAKAQFVEPVPVDTRELGELPEGWAWATLEELAQIRNGVTKGRDLTQFNTVELPYLRVANVQDGYLDLDVVKTIKVKEDEVEKYRVKPGDVLFTEGGDRDKLGRGTVWRGEIESCLHQNHIHCARLYSTDILPEWISLASTLRYARDYFWSAASQTVNLASLNASSLKAFVIPIAPANEQKRIIERVESLFAQAEEIERAVKIARRRTDKMEQAILARAFRGEL